MKNIKYDLTVLFYVSEVQAQFGKYLFIYSTRQKIENARWLKIEEQVFKVIILKIQSGNLYI